MTRTFRHFGFGFLLLGFTGSVLLGQSKDGVKKAETKAEPAPAAKAATHKVEKAPFKIEVTLRGTFEAQDTTELVLRPEVWTNDLRGSLSVLKAVEHGTLVKKGDTLVWLDFEKIDQAIREMEADRQIAGIALQQAEAELPLAESSTPLDLQAAERAKKHADEDLKKFLDSDKKLTLESADYGVKSATNYLAYAEEELKQLKKMYRASDLREDTEEIIVRRQEHAVEASRFQLRMAKNRQEMSHGVEVPRREQTIFRLKGGRPCDRLFPSA